MSRRVIYFFIVILLLFLLISKINATVHSTTLYYALRVQKNYLNFLHKINNSIDRCFEQALLIDSLRKKIITLEEKQYRTDSFNQELKTIYKQYNTKLPVPLTLYPRFWGNDIAKYNYKFIECKSKNFFIWTEEKDKWIFVVVFLNEYPRGE